MKKKIQWNLVLRDLNNHQLLRRQEKLKALKRKREEKKIPQNRIFANNDAAKQYDWTFVNYPSMEPEERNDLSLPLEFIDFTSKNLNDFLAESELWKNEVITKPPVKKSFYVTPLPLFSTSTQRVGKGVDKEIYPEENKQPKHIKIRR